MKAGFFVFFLKKRHTEMHWPWDPHSHVPIWIITPAPRNLGVTLVCRLYQVIVQDFAQGTESPESILSLEYFLSFQSKPFF